MKLNKEVCKKCIGGWEKTDESYWTDEQVVLCHEDYRKKCPYCLEHTMSGKEEIKRVYDIKGKDDSGNWIKIRDVKWTTNFTPPTEEWTKDEVE